MTSWQTAATVTFVAVLAVLAGKRQRSACALPEIVAQALCWFCPLSRC